MINQGRAEAGPYPNCLFDKRGSIGVYQNIIGLTALICRVIEVPENSAEANL
jgi:hypothetical protein